MKKYILFSLGTDDGKPFDNLSEALEYLYQRALHTKIHLDGTLIKTEITESKFSLFIERYDYFFGRHIEEMGIRYFTEEDIDIVKKYCETNGLSC